MSQHFKEMSARQNDATKRVIANTFSKNADILEDLYSQVEGLSSELENAKSQIQQLNNKVTQLSSAAVAGKKIEKERV